VLNGMWQTSGGWGRIDRDDAVEAMLRYADAGLSTFDMADHCTFTFSLLAAILLMWTFPIGLIFVFVIEFSVTYELIECEIHIFFSPTFFYHV